MAAPEPRQARPYATLLAKGEDRRQRILGVAERLLAAQRLAQHFAGADRQGSRRDPGRAAAPLRVQGAAAQRGARRPRRRRRRPRGLPVRRPDHRAQPGARAVRARARTGRHLHRAARREHRPRRSAARPPAPAVSRRHRHHHRHRRARSARRDSTARISMRPPRPSRFSPSSTEWRPYGCSILQYRSPRCSRGTRSRWVATWRHGARHEVPARCGRSQRRRRRQVRRRLDVRPGDGRLGCHRAARRRRRRAAAARPRCRNGRSRIGTGVVGGAPASADGRGRRRPFRERRAGAPRRARRARAGPDRGHAVG